jgi:hypothetical protein
MRIQFRMICLVWSYLSQLLLMRGTCTCFDSRNVDVIDYMALGGRVMFPSAYKVTPHATLLSDSPHFALPPIATHHT